CIKFIVDMDEPVSEGAHFQEALSMRCRQDSFPQENFHRLPISLRYGEAFPGEDVVRRVENGFDRDLEVAFRGSLKDRLGEEGLPASTADTLEPPDGLADKLDLGADLGGINSHAPYRSSSARSYSSMN